MSLKILKAGVLDSIQDTGRHGYQQFGINAGGAMDGFSAQLANALLGKEAHAPVIESHFPAAEILFQQENIICITGADFSPSINNERIALNQPVMVSKGSVLKFSRKVKGARSYLSFLNELNISQWLNSYSTNFKAGAGGFGGRRLMQHDEIEYRGQLKFNLERLFRQLPWKTAGISDKKIIQFLPGQEWDWLDRKTQAQFLNASFSISSASDRMAYRLKGEPMQRTDGAQLISSPVSFGTLQLPTDGQLILLMADRQTTGGYPRVGHVVTADLPLLAQMEPGEELSFELTGIENAEEQLLEQQHYLGQLERTCKLKMESYLNAG